MYYDLITFWVQCYFYYVVFVRVASSTALLWGQKFFKKGILLCSVASILRTGERNTRQEKSALPYCTDVPRTSEQSS